MRVGAFELQEPVPQLREPHMLVALRPWIDVGTVGTLILSTLEKHLQAKELGRLHRPGAFYDLTRYRPMLYRKEGRRHVEVPSSVIRYAHGPGTHDLAFLHALEPHIQGEEFVESVVKVAEYLGVRRYCQVGAMYGVAPHTRPLAVIGSASEPPVQEYLDRVGVKASTYEGPTSITALATEQAQERDIETLHLLVQLPPYARLEEDHRGQEILLRLLEELYGLGIELDPIAREGARQYDELEKALQADPRAQAVIRQMESSYDAAMDGETVLAEAPPLSPDVEQFLRELETGNGAS